MGWVASIICKVPPLSLGSGCLSAMTISISPPDFRKMSVLFQKGFRDVMAIRDSDHLSETQLKPI